MKTIPEFGLKGHAHVGQVKKDQECILGRGNRMGKDRGMTQLRHTTSNTVLPEHGISEVEIMGRQKIFLGAY